MHGRLRERIHAVQRLSRFLLRDGWIETLDWVLQQDVNIIDVGHYTPTTKEGIAAERAYMVDLHQQVLDLLRAGQSWDELYRNVHFSDAVKKWTRVRYDARIERAGNVPMGLEPSPRRMVDAAARCMPPDSGADVGFAPSSSVS